MSFRQLAPWSFLLGSALFWTAPAAAKGKLYAIAIGNNAAPAVSSETAALAPLKYADDDAASLSELFEELGADVSLLTVMDADTQRRFPRLASRAEPPTLAGLRRVVARAAVQLERDRENGVDSVLVLFFSGHGVQGAGEQSYLSLLDEKLTQAVLYDEILPHLPAKYVHLIVDACHAESVVRPRDLNVELTPVTSDDAARYRARWTLERFPQVGALVAATSSAQAQEWDHYRQGVFTHEILSGLRGAADVNGDRVVEYSELDAFLSAANSGVQDARARAAVVVKAPTLNARAPLVDLSVRTQVATLGGLSGAFGHVYVEDELGASVLEMSGEQRFAPELAVPAGRRLFVHSRLGEASILAQPGERIQLQARDFQPTTLAARGAMEAALLDGLYANAFGPTYYRGYVDARSDLVPVAEWTTSEATQVAADRPARPTGEYVAFGGSGVLLLGSLGFTIDALSAAHTYDQTSLERPAAEARTRFERDRWIAIGAASGGAVLAGLGVWLELDHHAESATRVGFMSGTPGLSLARAW